VFIKEAPDGNFAFADAAMPSFGLETVENFQQIGGAKCKTDPGDIFLDQFLRIDANHFAS
jgi:hypothetical protein